MPVNRSVKPSEKGTVQFALPRIEHLQLNNGLKILYVHKDNLPLLQMYLILDSGSKYEPRNNAGLANLTAHMLDEGAGKFTALELDEELEFLGTDLSISVNHDNVFISLLSLENTAEKSLELLSMIVQEPSFSEPDFQREKNKILTKLVQLKSEPSYLASVNFDKVLFGNSAYGNPIYGIDNNIKNFVRNDLIDYYTKYFSPVNAAIMVASSIPQNEITALLNKYLGNWKTGKLSPESSLPEMSSSAGLYILHKENAPQSEIRIGHRASGRKTKDYFAKTVMNSILGGQFTSRINLNLRENKGFTYGAHSAFYYKQDVSYFSVSTAVQTENTAAAVSEIFKELKNIKKEITQKELDFAKSNLVKTYPSKFETYSQITGNLAALHIFGLEDNYFDTYISNISKINLPEVLAAAQENIHENETAIVIVGDREKVEASLEKETGLKTQQLKE